MKLKFTIINYSTYIKSHELMECFKLLSSKYRKLNTTIYIFKSNKQFICFLLKKFRLIQFLQQIISPVIDKLTKSESSAFYNVLKKEIYVFEDKAMTYCDKGINGLYLSESYKVYGKYLKDTDLLKAKEMWIKYIILDILIHEMTHALQHTEKRLSTPITRIFKKWENLNEEKEAVTASIKAFKKNHDKFCEILNVKGIKIKHTIDPIRINYKYTIYVKKH
ncbi:MAG: hypothetical protein E6300_16605 [Clostridium sp.]|uniref:hypothetical protein n=1 Tax=Clostridium sp. TaxID=1506 RepID=UPI00290ADF21|nr:hypothetical protein [Clostridium sp.]MDU7150098.1 hypothetical protein [Clostridium sp.]